jgi:hypothetical protein
MIASSFSVLLLLSPGYSPVSNVAAITTEVWNQTSGNLASTDANWLDGTKPISSADTYIIFNDTSTAACTWDLDVSIGNFSIMTGYTGIVTQTANLGVTSFYQEAGTFTGSASKTVTDSGNFARVGGTLTVSLTRLTMTGHDGTINIGATQTLLTLTISDDTTINTLITVFNLAIASDKTLTVPLGLLQAFYTGKTKINQSLRERLPVIIESLL